MASLLATLRTLPVVLRAGLGVLVGAALSGSGGVAGPLEVAAGLACVVALTLPALRATRPFALGLALGVAVDACERSPPGSDALASRLAPGDTRVSVSGTVASSEPPAADGTRWLIDAESSESGEGRSNGPSRLRVLTLSDPGEPPSEPLPGDSVVVDGLASTVRPPSNPGGYDAQAAWAREGVHARLVVPDPRGVRTRVAADGPLAGIAALRNACASTFSTTLSAADAGLVRSLLLGDRGALDPADRKRFRDAGVAHILAISGAHVALLVAALLWLSRRVGCPPRPAAGVLLALVALFVPFTGSAAPVVRSAAGCALYLLGRLFHREPSPGVLLAAVAAGYVVWEPSAFSDPGFRLSFAAAAGMVLLAGRLIRWLVPERPALPGMPSRPRAPVRAALGVGVAAWLASLPVSLHDLGQVSWIAVPMGMVAVPVSSLAMALGVIHVAVHGVPVVGPAARSILEWLLVALRWFLDLPAGVGIGNHYPDAPPFPWYLAYLAAMVLVSRGGRRGAAAGWVALVLLLAFLAIRWPVAPPDQPRLTLLDVGHGQAALLETPDGRKALLDAGSRDRPECADRIVLPALRALRVRSLDLVVASHSDSDHAGALPAVVDDVPTARAAVPPGFAPATLEALRHGCAETRTAVDGDVLLSGAWGALRVLGPARRPSPGPKRSTNDGCLVLLLETPDGNVLLPGDREDRGVDDLLGAHPDLRADVLVLPHHGHPSAGRDRLVRACRPALSLASAPRDVVDRLPAGARCTATDGALVLDLVRDGPRLTTPWAPNRHPPSGYDPPADPRAPMNDPLMLLVAGGALVAIAWIATRLRWLTAPGSAAAACLGFAAVHAFGWPGLAALLAPFLVATLLGRAPGGLEKAGPRTLKQVAANGIPAVVGIAFAWAGRYGEGAAAFLGALAALGGDTIATEVGTRWGGTPHSVFSGRAVAKGESGGVTWVGTFASVAGAALAPAAFLAVGGASWSLVLPFAGVGAMAGYLDSLLGATLQRKGRCPACGATVESETHCDGKVPERLPGRLAFLDNDGVNLINGLAGAALAWFLFGR